VERERVAMGSRRLAEGEGPAVHRERKKERPIGRSFKTEQRTDYQCFNWVVPHWLSRVTEQSMR